ncbi:MAG TPA: cytochrome c biogenesis protein CcdA [Methylomirabilota bacterium]|nr:cytochrome c biogenesis protein CcdA [Methylomirabilota bacterium]
MTRRSRFVSVVAATLLFRVAVAHAQLGGGNTPTPETLMQVVVAPVTVAAGGTATASVKLTILAGWHVNANPPAMEYNIPTTVTLAGAGGLTSGRVHYPPGKQEKFGFDDAPLLVYDGTLVVNVPIAAAADAKSGTLDGKVEYQACNNEVCLAPTEVPFRVQVNVTAAGAPAGTAGRDTANGSGAGDVGSFESAPTAAAAGSSANAVSSALDAALARGGFGWLLALFVGGLLLNLTPCVFPMLGVTVSIFGARRNEPLPKVVTTAVLYVLGICVTYTALGAVAALTGGLFGEALRSVWVNLVLGGLMLVLSLGMFGVYEMQPPLWLMDRLGGAQATNMAGAFVSGLGVGIIAAPCVGPFVVAVLALIAQRADVGFGVVTMFTLSLGLGFPYLFLATFSNLLQTLPRSGDWMVWVKHALGLLLASIGVYYLCVGLVPNVSPWVLPAGLVLGGLWLGFLDKSAGTTGAFSRFAKLAGALALFAGVFVGGRMYQASLRTLSFRQYDAAAVEASIAAGRPVMVDFTADWCLPCHELELNTFADTRVVAAAKRFDRYRVDLTHKSPEGSELSKRYRVAGPPIVVFLGKGGNEVAEARVVGFLPPERFLQQMEIGATR